MSNLLRMHRLQSLSFLCVFKCLVGLRLEVLCVRVGVVFKLGGNPGSRSGELEGEVTSARSSEGAEAWTSTSVVG